MKTELDKLKGENPVLFRVIGIDICKAILKDIDNYKKKRKEIFQYYYVKDVEDLIKRGLKE